MPLVLAAAIILSTSVLGRQALADAPSPTTEIAPPPGIALAAGERLAHEVVSGALGPWAKVRVVLTQADDVNESPFTGRVVLADGQTTPLPAPDEPAVNFMMTVNAVAFRSVDADAVKELLVLYSAVQIGPQHSPYHGVCVYKWDGERFIRLNTVESRLHGARSVTDVNKRLVNTAPANPQQNR